MTEPSFESGSQPQYANLDLSNIILVTLPQPILVQMMRTGGVALGNRSRCRIRAMFVRNVLLPQRRCLENQQPMLSSRLR